MRTKRILSLLFLVSLLLPCFAACVENPAPEQPTHPITGAPTDPVDTHTPTDMPTDTSTDDSTDVPTNTPTDVPTEPGTDPDDEPGLDPAVKAEEYYQNGYTYNSVVGIDQFGRTIAPSMTEREDKYVGMFYYIHRESAGIPIYDISKILQMENGLNKLLYENSSVSPENTTHWWGEPLYGYYNSGDKWVIRRHLELFTYAGIDFLMMDCTNNTTHNDRLQAVLDVVCEMRAEGWDVPQVCVYLNTNTDRLAAMLYKQFYKKGTYDDAWFKLDGKPLLVGSDLHLLTDEVENYFTLRECQWPTEDFKANGFPWVEFSYPAKPHNGIYAVAAAANTNIHFSYALHLPESMWSRGKGWDVVLKKNVAENAAKGSFYQAQWDKAFEYDPRIVFCTQWNEWTASKYHVSDDYYTLTDITSMEFSRDMELMKGGYNDAFLIQTAINARKFKAGVLDPTKAIGNTVVDINTLDWESVPAVFRDVGTDNTPRNSPSFSAFESYYTEAAARNNVVEVRVATDTENIYFYIKSTDNITAYQNGDTKWMNLFIGTGSVSQKGWESYEYVINRTVLDGETGAVEKLNSDFSGEQVGTASYTVNGDVMIVTVSRSTLGLGAEDNAFYFKLADNITVADDIMDYYVSGKSLPVGRLSFQYMGW